VARSVTAAALDVACILIFVAIGRHTHDHGITVAGLASTSWPFLAGAAAGWLVWHGWRAPERLVPTGVAVWLSSVGLGMVLRVVSGQGTAVAFVIVALVFLGSTLLGWRVLRGWAVRRNAHRHA
jgi:FtsH-binding integral membrane protein